MPQPHLGMSNMVDRQFENINSPGPKHSMLPLPLNLIAIIISYVRSIPFRFRQVVTNRADHDLHSWINPRTSLAFVGVVAPFTT